MQSIFITGAASGIGRATAKLFASRDWLVGLYDVDARGLQSLATEIGADKCVTGALDVTDVDAFKRSVAAFGARTEGRMDALFNCAGILRMGPFESVSPADAHKEVAINVNGVINGVYAALPSLEKTPKSIIVSMSSASAIYGTPDHSVYSATKFAVRGLTEALEVEFRPKDIRVTDIMPGYVAGPMVDSQTHKSPMLQTFGIKHDADEIARLVWDAVHGDRVHWVPRANHKVFIRLAGFTSFARSLMSRFAKA